MCRAKFSRQWLKKRYFEEQIHWVLWPYTYLDLEKGTHLENLLCFIICPMLLSSLLNQTKKKKDRLLGTLLFA